MNIIERAARALWEADGSPTIAVMPSPNQTVAYRPDWPKYYEKARAVLLAIREPSEAMRSAAIANNGIGPHTATVVWQAMIDAAMGEG